ncbi:MAG: coenzyme F420-0:L-glutamate ligase [Aestuariibacter sp.]
MTGSLQIIPIHGIPLIEEGQDLGAILAVAIAGLQPRLSANDVLVVAHKIISKGEGAVVNLQSVAPSKDAVQLAAIVDKDPRFVQVVLDHSSEVIRAVKGVLITRHKRGFVCANAGIDQSNVNQSTGEYCLLLPENPDESARLLKSNLATHLGVDPAVIISDSFGRAWRQGTVGTCIGSSGLEVLYNQNGEQDLFGRELKVTMAATADQIAAAATLVMGESNEGIPAALVRGLDKRGSDTAQQLIRPPSEDLFGPPVKGIKSYL